MVDLKLLRVKADHMTQTELSKQSGVNRTTISAVENGQVPSIRTAVKLAKILGIDWKCFYEP
jgi:DNA-binding XRE family transcriptional regulator